MTFNQSQQRDLSVDLPFRESRSYIHSTSICNFFSDCYPDANRFELVLKKILTSRVLFKRVDNVQMGFGYVRLTLDGEQCAWTISEDEKHPVSERDSYDEAAIAECCEVEGEAIHCKPCGVASFFDRLIAANKSLIHQSVDPSLKLLAAKVVIDGFLPDETVFSLELISHAKKQIFRSHLMVDGIKHGEVIFYAQV